VINLCYTDNGDAKRAFGRADFVAKLEAEGVTFRRVEEPSSAAICLWFNSLEADGLRSLRPEVLRRLVVVAEREMPPAEQAELTRTAIGLLAVVEPSAWRNWQRGLFVAWGLYGDERVAAAAGLMAFDAQGLQPANKPAPLPTMLARFLIAAQQPSELEPVL
jgi:hypothetical protein